MILKCSILFLLFAIAGYNCHAQGENCFSVNKAYPNIANKSILENYPEIDSIGIKFELEKPTDLHVWYKPGATYPKEWYNWEFEGDIYLFKKQFPKANLPVLPKEEIYYMAGQRKCNTSTDYFLNAVVHRDSVQYKFSQCCPSDTDWLPIGFRYRPGAYYNGNIRDLAKLLEKKYDKMKYQPAGDSVLIFQAIVGKENPSYLQDIKLIAGIKSSFSDFIQLCLEEAGASWLPAVQGGRQVKSFIRIYARLNNDGSITLSTS